MRGKRSKQTSFQSCEVLSFLSCLSKDSSGDVVGRDISVQPARNRARVPESGLSRQPRGSQTRSDLTTGPVTTAVSSPWRSTAICKAESHSSFHWWCHLWFNPSVLQRLSSWTSVTEVLLCSLASASLFTFNFHLSLNRQIPLELWAIKCCHNSLPRIMRLKNSNGASMGPRSAHHVTKISPVLTVRWSVFKLKSVLIFPRMRLMILKLLSKGLARAGTRKWTQTQLETVRNNMKTIKGKEIWHDGATPEQKENRGLNKVVISWE